MKRLLIYIIGVALAVTACDIERSDNGDLDGLWQLAAVDTLPQGGTADMRDSQITWGVQGSLLETRVAPSEKEGDIIVFRFSHTGDELVLTQPYIYKREKGDIAVENDSLLMKFGITRLEEHFKVLELTGSHMQLQSDRLRLHFRKY
jgi:hypothetical protein